MKTAHLSIRAARREDAATLLDIWRRSVRATHSFLGETQIAELTPAVRAYFAEAGEMWVLAGAEGRAAGFMGLAGNEVESLFIAPDHMRLGAGTMLLRHARRLKGPLRVEVNEQNPAAVSFYEANGFRVTGRSPVDGAGRPFPLLFMSEAGAAAR